MNEDQQKSDHDLLIEIHTVLKRAVDDIRDLKDGLDSRVKALESDWVKRKEYEEVSLKTDRAILIASGTKKWLAGVAASIALICALVSYIWITQIGEIKADLDYHIRQTTLSK